eukprot:2668168-Amphidinium_carterae.1
MSKSCETLGKAVGKSLKKTPTLIRARAHAARHQGNFHIHEVVFQPSLRHKPLCLAKHPFDIRFTKWQAPVRPRCAHLMPAILRARWSKIRCTRMDLVSLDLSHQHAGKPLWRGVAAH